MSGRHPEVAEQRPDGHRHAAEGARTFLAAYARMLLIREFEQAIHRLGSGCGQRAVRALADGDDDGVSGQLLQWVVGGGDRRRHRSILGAPLACSP